MESLREFPVVGGTLVFDDGDMYETQWSNIKDMAKKVREEIEEERKEEGHDRECDCDFPETVDGDVPMPELDSEDDMEPPARYYVQTSNHGYWCNSYKPNQIFGIDLIWTQKIKGKDVVVTGTVMSSDISIFDYESSMTLEKFENIRKQTFDYAVQKAQEAKLDADELKSVKKKERDDTVEEGRSSADSVMKSYQ